LMISPVVSNKPTNKPLYAALTWLIISRLNHTQPLQHSNATAKSMSSSSLTTAQSVILIVDPYSTGCLVAMEIIKRGYPIMA
jgi:hypothetical protein